MLKLLKIVFLLVAFFTSTGLCGKRVPYGVVGSAKPFDSGRLFAVLDSVGQSSSWFEWDDQGAQDPSVLAVVKARNLKDNIEMVWVMTNREKPLVALLEKRGSGEELCFFEVDKMDGKPVMLKMNVPMNPEKIFRDYKQINSNTFVHLDKPNLKVSITEKRLRFTYDNPDGSPLTYDPEFSKRSLPEKKAMVQGFKDYMEYEYSLMLRAFIGSTRNLFNWQPWHWYMPAWNKNYMISEPEILGILSQGRAPGFITVFKAKCVGGEMVEFRTDGNGFSEMSITLP
ncbi:MAG: hypothetical protein HUK21_02885 [Fibrobacteraceae bacterium]|nr:hypothetical protein [Fibrobacteraceae bacterium]